MWKPGQLVTINNKVYRVTKCPKRYNFKHLFVCTVCSLENRPYSPPCFSKLNGGDFGCVECGNNVGPSCYLKPLTLCGDQARL